MRGDSSSPFTSKTLSFLRSLKRNNRREWFHARKDQYQEHVHQPMVAVIERLANDFRTVAPELIASPRHSLFRVYRDTRFSHDKRPLKTHAAAVFRPKDLPKPQGAGLYFEVAPDWVWIGGGMWRPEPPELVRLRAHMARTWPRIRTITRAAAFRTRFGELQGNATTRVPRGYAADHPAADFLKFRQFHGGAEFPAAFAHSREFYPTLLATFKALMPLVRFLNAPLVAGHRENQLTLAAGMETEIRRRRAR
ncbi:MAG TPA: DUF2461 domain-containing protein [Vicinamibacterales bacterium]